MRDTPPPIPPLQPAIGLPPTVPPPLPRDVPPPLPPDAAQPVASAPPAPVRRRFLGALGRTVRAGFFGTSLGAGIGVVGLAAAAGTYLYAVVAHPGPAFERGHIQAIVAQESPVTYRDGTTRVGVFFEQQHRRYVPFDELPQAWVMSIVAIEDRRFWTHWGFDPRGIGRAVRENVTAGAIVSGGSTLTQQTAKNLFDRPDRSLHSKGVELLNALRLEAHYDKAEILELYANQFHVTGNGRGLGIAARHFFDKDPDELTLAECAFLAGMVKAPTTMDPFFGGDEAWREAAAARAHARTEVVLRELVALPVESLVGPAPGWQPASRATYARRYAGAVEVQAEANRLLNEGFTLGFKRGPFRYDRSAALDEVARRLREPPFDTLLPGGIDDPRNAGVTVVTTLDADAQREATYALWHHLTETGARLEQLGVEDYVLDHPGPKFDPDFPPLLHEFRLGRVAEHTVVGGKKELSLDLGGHACRVDRDAVVRVASAAWQGSKGDPYAKTPTAEVDGFVDAIADGSVVLVSIRDPAGDGVARCDLELRPTLQGAVTVVQDGEVLAMVGGNDNRDFNRALAPRQLGSTFKPLVFHAALKLGWSPDEPLDNTRNVFPFSGTFYYPSPDHEPAPRVSLAWAGTRSENLGSVWLLYHLLDDLDDQRLAALAAATDLARRPAEDDKAYRERLMSVGILPSRERLEQSVFSRAKRDVLAALPGSEHPEDATDLRTLGYGWGYDAERKRVRGNGTRLRALDADWHRVEAHIDGCVTQHAALVAAMRHGGVPAAGEVRDLRVHTAEDGFLEVACGSAPEGYGPVTAAALGDRGPGQLHISLDDGLSVRLGRGGLPEERDLRIDGLHVSTLEALRAAMAGNRERLQARADDGTKAWLDPVWLYHHDDFRTLLAMRYVAALAAEYGVHSEIRPVLSLPLGVSEITVEEATALYEGLVTGRSHAFAGVTANGPVAPVQASTALIREVRSADGKLMYRAEAVTEDVASPRVGAMTADILRNVVLHGTGVRAAQAVTANGHPVPLGGKTGTTNDFRNAAFVGYVPAVRSGRYDPTAGLFVGTYVGYDDNRPLTNGRIRLAGSSGALPVWIGTAQGLQAAGLLGAAPAEGSALEAGAAWPMTATSGLRQVVVDAKTGLPDPAGTAAVLVRAEADAPVATARERREQQRARRGARRDGGTFWERLVRQLGGQ
ncbi:MAG: transglycosylase domain-containing protein [Myxococcota bacterium]